MASSFSFSARVGRAEQAKIEKQIEKITAAYLDDDAMLPATLARFKQKANDLEQRGAAIKAELEADEAQLAIAEKGQRSIATWKRDFATLQKALASGDVDVRIRLRNHLQELITKIEVFGKGHRQLFDPDAEHKTRDVRDGDDLAEMIYDVATESDPKLRRDKQFHAFLKYVTARRMSKDGRFLRVHFTTGATVDIVPPGSLASGVVLAKPRRKNTTWQSVSPSIERLWGEFIAAQAKSERGVKLSTT